MKDLDEVRISWSITGRLTTRVALMEVLSTGAVPQMMTVAISNEPYPTGEGILEGVREELVFARLTLPMAISTEKNIITQQTGLGVSVIGVAEKNQLRIGTSQSGDNIYCLGFPKVGPEINNPEDSEIVQIHHIQALLNICGVHDIIPVGSRGIHVEAQQLASNVKKQMIVDPSCVLDLHKSAGPSTCLIVSASSSSIFDLKSSGFERLPLTKLGRLD